MEKTTQTSLTEKLIDPHVENINPHEVARELIQLHKSKNIKGIKELREAYLIGVGRLYPIKNADEIRYVVDGNLMFAAGIADKVNSCGYESSGQLHTGPKLSGPVAQFYQEVTEYKPQ